MTRTRNSLIWQHITMLRGLAAAYVLLHHIRNALWWAVEDVSKTSTPILFLINALVAGAFRFGHMAVLAFFVISGASIHLATLERGQRFEASGYFRRRCQRLYPVLIASMTLTGLLLVWLAPEHFFTLTSLEDAIGTLTFQQTILTGSFGGNTPYWSLANEGYYYASYPILLWLIFRVNLSCVTVVCTLASLAMLLLIPNMHELPIYYPVWLAGVWVASRLLQKQPLQASLLYAGAMALGGSLLATLWQKRIAFPYPTAIQLAGGLGCAVIICWLLQKGVLSLLNSWWSRALETLGNISYPLYTTHFPIVCCIAVLLPNPERSIGIACLASCMSVILSVFVAVALHQWVEAPYLKRSKQARLRRTTTVPSPNN